MRNFFIAILALLVLALGVLEVVALHSVPVANPLPAAPAPKGLPSAPSSEWPTTPP